MLSGRPEDLGARLHAAAVRLLRLARESEGRGLNGPRLAALATAARVGPVSLAALAAAEGVRPPTMSRLVEGLVREGLLDRVSRPEDRRSVVISITDKGRDALDRDRRHSADALAGRIAHLAESERRALARALDLIDQVTAR